MIELFPGNYPWSQAALRAIFVGGSAGDVLEAVERLTGKPSDDIDAWYAAWSAIGYRLDDRGRTQAERGYAVSAADSL